MQTVKEYIDMVFTVRVSPREQQLEEALRLLYGSRRVDSEAWLEGSRLAALLVGNPEPANPVVFNNSDEKVYLANRIATMLVDEEHIFTDEHALVKMKIHKML